ncbi:MAG: preprotein translocase subunit SecY [Thermofilaceae archaeon]|nr:preprotein translocase subunit SecY [Thermofilaceae archaeon]MCX8180621.1 preprotein translocase subunit SecY [Thermofilaceae archaeon]MDW8003723.1 preprotein translocase subunit SecY [Thermofilaceae archaeon]
MSASSILSLLFKFVPEIPRPTRKLRLTERLLWTSLILILYMALCQVPLYGIRWSEQSYQPMLLVQVIMASERGTLMELGIGPLVTAGIVWQLLVGSGIIELDLSTREGRRFYAGVQKLLSLLFAFFNALAFILGGVYGNLTLTAQVMVLGQLMVASLIILLMDDMLEKGWGVGSAVSLFIAAGVARRLFWELFSPVGPVDDGLFVGIIPSFFHSLAIYAATGNNTMFVEVMARKTGYPDLVGFISMIVFLILLTYLDSMRIEIPVAAARYGGLKARIPLKFLYVSNLPVILVSTLYANMYMIARAVWTRFNPDNTNPLLNWFVMYNATTMQPLKPSLMYYITTPRGISALSDPMHVVIYTLLFVGLSMVFALIWVMATGMDPSGQAEQFSKAQLQVPGFRSSTKVLESLLKPYIWSLTVLSGALVGLIAVVSDILGTLGSGIGLLLTVGIMTQYQQLLAREQLFEMHPTLSKLIGAE